MNKPLRRLFVVFVLMFGVLVGFTSWWTVFGAEDLKEKPSNRRPLLKAQKIPRGLILAEDGTRLATNRRTGSRETKRYYRAYPESRLFSHAVGYSFVSRGSTGIERFYNDELIGEHEELESIIDQLGGGVEEGDDVRTHLDANAQRVAIQQLAGRRGSVVARRGAPAAGAGRHGAGPRARPAAAGPARGGHP
jgi:peptidoglycan glycosyltransferase